MTTDRNIVIAKDLFSENPIVKLIRIRKGLELAGIEFEIDVGPGESRGAARKLCFNLALQQLRLAWPGLSLWLFVGDSTWRRKSAVAIYRRLWWGLRAVLPNGERTDEVRIDGPEGIRYFGAIHVSAGESDRAFDMLSLERASFIVASTAGHAPALDERLLETWQRDQPEIARWSELAAVICQDGNLLFRPFGFFDDVGAGVDLI
jgi:hypothetical protein